MMMRHQQQQQMQMQQGNYPPPYSQHSQQRMRMPFQQGSGNIGNDQQQFGTIQWEIELKMNSNDYNFFLLSSWLFRFVFFSLLILCDNF